ncbi:hypothetical protein THER5_1924 [Bifidobacterium thermacidophilum subsp. thermacidophilum]|uniref:Uncharacterized protein n=1 Tax=Bifidobacterium thermacidophilum subsp. thermacidophilum TaxID=79262 RepID=A0A087E3B6_9BIFI|nr:hypothetical protein THER5_1924 [Bifidobacterium thermacidophilum subsp. thermacidophilum]
MVSDSVRVMGPRGGRWTEFGAGPAGGLLGFCGFGVVAGWCLRVGRCRCGPDRFSVLVLWFGPWFGCFGWMAGRCLIVVLLAGRWNSGVFGVVAGWCLRVGRCRCGPDRFSVLVLWFGPWFGCFGRMAWRWLIVVVCVIHWNQTVL